MNEVKTMKRFNPNNEPKTISSREVAEMMGMSEHKNMLRKIDSINEILLSSNVSSIPYWTESTYKDSIGRTLREYQVTKKGCELIAHKTDGEKGVIFTVKYMERFDEMEQALKEQTIDVSMLPPGMQLFKQIFDQQAQMYIDAQKMQQQVETVENKLESIKEVVGTNTDNWRSETNKLLSKIAKEIGGGTAYRDVRIESYDLLNSRMGVNLERRLSNKRMRAAESGVSKSKRDELSLLDVIADDKKLIEGYTAIVKEMAIRYGIA